MTSLGFILILPEQPGVQKNNPTRIKTVPQVQSFDLFWTFWASDILMENIQIMQIVVGIIIGGIIAFIYFNNKKGVSTDLDGYKNYVSKDLYEVEKSR